MLYSRDTTIRIQYNPNVRELSILYPGLVYFIYVNTGSNLGPDNISLISGPLISGWHCTFICGNIINNNDERTHFFSKIYLSHFIRKGCERVVCERWVGDWTDCNILTPSSSDYCSTSFLILLGHSTGGSEDPSPLSRAGSHCLELQLELQLQLTPTHSNCLWHRVI